MCELASRVADSWNIQEPSHGSLSSAFYNPLDDPAFNRVDVSEKGTPKRSSTLTNLMINVTKLNLLLENNGRMSLIA